MILKLIATTLVALVFAVTITRGNTLYSDAESVFVTFAGVAHWLAGSLSPRAGH